MNRLHLTRVAIGGAIALYALLSLLHAPAPLKIVAAALLFFFLPGWIVIRCCGASLPRLDRLVLPLTLSPVIVTICLIMLRLLGLAFDDGVSIFLAAAAGVAILLVLLGRPRPEAIPAPPPGGASILLVPVLFAGIVAVAYGLNHFLLVRSDAWTHACYVREILDRGVPPMEPRFPDVSIRYMWFYHLFVAAFVRTAGTGVFASMGFFNVVAAFSFPYLVARLTGLFTDRPGIVRLVPLFATAGFESPVWVLWPLNLLRALAGKVRDANEITRIVERVDLHSPAVIDSMRIKWTWMVSLIDKYVTVTVFGYSLNLFVFCAFLVIASIGTRSSRARLAVMTVLLAAGALIFHVVTGVALVAATIGAGLLFALLQKRRLGRFPDVSATLVAPAAATLAAIAILPYVLSLTGGESGETSGGMLQFGLTSLLTIAAPLLVLFPFTRAGLPRLVRDRPERGPLLLCWMIPLLALNAVVDLPGVNESKLVFPLFILLAVPVTGELARRLLDDPPRRRIGAAVAALLLFLFPAAMTVRGFLLARPTVPFEFHRAETSEAERDLLDWISRRTPVDAVIIESDDHALSPVLARRRSFFPDEVVIATMGYGGPKVATYRAIRESLFSGRPIDGPVLAPLRESGRPFYILLWRKDAGGGRRAALDARPRLLEQVFGNSSGRIYRVIGTGQSADPVIPVGPRSS